jgi:hypothetical protein
VHSTRKKSHHEKNLLTQNVDISSDCRCHNRTQLFHDVNHDPQDLLLITTKNTRSNLNCGVHPNHNMIHTSKYVNDDTQNLVFVKLQNTRSTSASVTPTWWKPRTDGRSHYVDRLRPDNHHQQSLLEEGKPSVAPNINVSLLIERWRLVSNIRCLASLRVGAIVTSKRDTRHRSSTSSCQVDGSNFFFC